ncbi:MAG: AlpA family phage regulatory protein [Oleispira sp.]|nr:AlpA family phage regulatory protein [Oleispira sp.]MBL4881793.1 AlpA family phage regulatory protein [Oleispira sp.]
MNNQKIVRRPEVLKLLQLSRSSLYKKIENGLWPAPISLGARAKAWISTENEKVLSAMIAGQSQEEIRELVKRLTKDRQQFKGVAI